MRLLRCVSVSRSTRLELASGCPGDRRPVGELRRLEFRRARAVEHEMRVPRRGAVRDHRHRPVGGVHGIGVDLDVEHGGQAAEALRADAERVDLVVELDAQLLDLALRAPRAFSSAMSIGSISASLAISIAFSAVPPTPMPSMPGGHQPAPIVGTVFTTQSAIESEGLSIDELRLRLRAAALRGDVDLELVARHHLHVDHRRRVVPGVLAAEVGFVEHRGAQLVVRVHVGAAHAFVDRVFERFRKIEPHVHADLQEHVDDAGVLADRPVALGAHARIGEDLRDRVLRGRATARARRRGRARGCSRAGW